MPATAKMKPAVSRAAVAQYRARIKEVRNAYFVARATKEHVYDLAVSNYPAEPADDASDADVNAWGEAVEAALDAAGYYPAATALDAAELALIETSGDAVKNMFPDKWGPVEPAFRLGVKHSTRPRLIELCLKWIF